MSAEAPRDDRAVIEAVLREARADLERHPRRADIRHRAALCLVLLRRREQARRELEAALAENPRYFDARRTLAFLELADGRAEAGAAGVKRLRDDFPGDPRAPLSEGLYFAAMGKAGFARRPLEEAAAAMPRSALPHFAAALVLDRLGEPSPARREAEERFPEARFAGRDAQILGNPARAVAFREAAGLLARAGDPVGAERFADLAFSIDLDAALHALAGGDIGIAMGDIPEAARCYRRAVEIEPDLVQGRVALARALALRGDLDGACGEVEAAARLRPDYPDLGYLLGTLRLEGGDAAAAAAAFEAAIARNARYGAARHSLGQARLEAGDARGAEEAFASARAAGVRSAEMESGLGFARLAVGDAGGAAAAFGDAIALDDTLPGPHLGLALAAERRGDLVAARRHLAAYDAREADLSASDEAIALRRRLSGSGPPAA